MTPQTVNAVNLLAEALNFPAARLQPPFLDAAAPNAANYGAIGSVIGHEISHTFDTEGTRSMPRAHAQLVDAGGLRTLSSLDRQTRRAIRQLQTFPDLSVNGKQTLAEDIADIAGISAAYKGYRSSLKGQSAPVVHGFSGTSNSSSPSGRTTPRRHVRRRSANRS